MSGDIPYVIALVLNWNNYRETRKCLESLQGLNYNNYEIILIDNGSTDNSSQKLDCEFKNIDGIFLDENRGFAGGMNAGIKEALNRSANYVWLLNNDIIVPEEKSVLADLVHHLESDDRIGIISPRMYRPKTDEVVFHRGQFDPVTGDAWHENDNNVNNQLIQNDYIPFAAALIPTKVFSEIGLLSEEYFLYFEDVDFATKLQKAGFTLVTDPESVVFHRSATTTTDQWASYYNARNRLLFVRKHSDPTNAKFLISYIVSSIRKVGFEILERPPRQKVLNPLAYVRGMIDGIKGKCGKGPYP